MYRIMGWINVAIVSLMFLNIMLLKMNAQYFKKKDGFLFKYIKLMRKFHKPLGAILLITVVYHGILALGTLQLHTGTILGSIVLLTAIFGIAFQYIKKKQIFTLHKLFASILILLLLVHLVFPSIL